MIKLRVVGFSEDLSKLILSNKPRGKTGSHQVAIDKRLLDTLQEAVYARRERAKAERLEKYQAPPRDEPKVPPREIQRQLRAGMTTAQVARAAGVDEEYVERFLQPVIYERIEVINEAQEQYQSKPRLGDSGAPLGEAILANLAARRVKFDEDQLAEAWMATRANGGPWTIALSFPFRGRSRVARWRFEPRDKTVTPVNKLASDLGWVTPGKVKRTVEPARARVVNIPPAGSRAAAPKRAAAKRPVRKPAARKAAPKRATAKRAAAKRPARAPAKRAPARRAAPKRAAPKRAAKRAAPKRAPARRGASRRSPARRAPARTGTTKRSTTRRVRARASSRRTASRGSASRGGASRRAPARRSASRTASARRATSRRR